jgi:hypothetical protein
MYTGSYGYLNTEHNDKPMDLGIPMFTGATSKMHPDFNHQKP